jgi:hypothetical protein
LRKTNPKGKAAVAVKADKKARQEKQKATRSIARLWPPLALQRGAEWNALLVFRDGKDFGREVEIEAE